MHRSGSPRRLGSELRVSRGSPASSRPPTAGARAPGGVPAPAPTAARAGGEPVMEPVFPNTMHAGDVLMKSAGKPGRFKDQLQGRWQELHRRYGRGRGFAEFWDDALQRGGLYTEVPVRAVRLGPQVGRVPKFRDPAGVPRSRGADQLMLTVFPSIALHDRPGADKPWLQELPDPVAKTTGHSWVELHPA